MRLRQSGNFGDDDWGGGFDDGVDKRSQRILVGIALLVALVWVAVPVAVILRVLP